MSKHLFSGSGGERAIQCGASVSLPRVSETNEYGVEGTDNHKRNEEAIREGDWTKADRVVRDLVEPAEVLGVESAYVLDTRKRSVLYLGDGIDRAYGKLEPWQVPLTLDVVFRLDGVLWVVDWKSRKRVTPAANNIQLRLGGLAARVHRKASTAIIAIGYLDNGELDSAEDDELRDLETWQTLAAAVDPERNMDPHEGPWCEYCPSLSYCPAKTRLALAMMGELGAIDGTVEAMSVEKAGKAYEHAKDIERLLNRVLDALKARAKSEPLPLSNGKRLALVEQSRTSLDTAKAKATLEGAGLPVPMKTTTFTSLREVKGC